MPVSIIPEPKSFAISALNEAVYDIDRIRQAFGDKQLTAVAYSYGTQIAALYAERFPYNVRSIVLLMESSISMTRRTTSHGNSNRHRVIRKRLIALHPRARTKSCPLSSDRDKAITQFHELLSKLHHKPLLDSKGENISSDELISLTTDLLLWRSSWLTLCNRHTPVLSGIVSNEIETALSAPIASEESS